MNDERRPVDAYGTMDHIKPEASAASSGTCPSDGSTFPRLTPRWTFIRSDVSNAVDDMLNRAEGHDRNHFLDLVVAEIKKMQNV